MLYFSDKIDFSVLGCVCICIWVIVSVYIKNVFAREKKFLRLIFLSIFVFLLCFLFVFMCYNFYK